MRRPAATRGLATSTGSVLLEVVVATLLVGLLVVPLAGAFRTALDEGRAMRERLAEAPGDGESPATPEGWDWGARVIAGWWRPGPTLHLKLSAGASLIVGLWADGWLVAEDEVDSGAAGEIEVQSSFWSGLQQGELIVRVREQDGVWGPPWRLGIPGASGQALPSGSIAATSGTEPGLVVHRPATGTSSLSLSWTPNAISTPPFGLLFVLAPAVNGWGGATLDERSQSWWMEDGRSVDLYF